MGLEAATYISGLNASNPTSSDNASQGDDHIRLVKSTLLSTFPNVAGAVTSSHTELNILDGVTASTAELNYVDGVTSAIQTQLDEKASLAGSNFTGAVTVVKNSQTAYGSAAITAKSTSGDVHIALWASGGSVVSIKHVRGGSGIAIVADDGSTTAPVSASDFTIPSDARLKDEVVSITDSGSIIDSLNGYRFKYIGTGKSGVGFIAQDVQKVLPELVTENENGFLGVSYSQVVAVLVEAVKELRAEMAKLKGGQNDIASICSH